VCVLQLVVWAFDRGLVHTLTAELRRCQELAKQMLIEVVSPMVAHGLGQADEGATNITTTYLGMHMTILDSSFDVDDGTAARWKSDWVDLLSCRNYTEMQCELAKAKAPMALHCLALKSGYVQPYLFAKGLRAWIQTQLMCLGLPLRSFAGRKISIA
jgi:hypothetical protein